MGICKQCGPTTDKVYTNGYCRVCQRVSARNRKYGRGAGEWARQREEENGGACDICGVVPSESLQLDHDHETGRWRGLVCRKCNYLIAAVEQSRDVVDRIEQYLLVEF